MTTSGSQPATSCSQDADTLRATLRELARRDAASTMQLAQIRAILAGVLADAGIEVTDDIVRLAVQVRAQVRALEADRAAIVEALLATGVSPASGDPVQLAAQVRELVRELRAERGEARAELRRIQALVERLRLEVPNLREQVRKLLTMDEATILLVEAERVINQGIITRLTAALREILHEAESDFDRDIIATAARGALKAVDA